ncbi:MAG: SGNH/GDSL hydrolase family protein [Verrucomicrobiales bacterium]
MKCPHLAACLRSAAPSALCVLFSAFSLRAGEHILVIGDSLSKEYEVEFKGLYPDNPDAWDARNWNEILDTERNSKFDLGSFSTYFDFRLVGHEFNVAKPGGTAREYRNFLRQDAAAEDEIKASSNGDFYWSQFPAWRETFNDLLGQAEKVVVFLGGNDLALGNSDPIANVEVGGDNVQVEYRTIYNAGPGDAGNPDRMRNTIRGNTRSVIQYLRVNRSYAGPIVICSAPHVGATPKIQEDVGTDPTKTARVTTMLEQLRDELRAQAAEFNCGFADVYGVTKKILDPEPFTIGGITFHKEADDDCRPRYLFSGDGFHPNTPAQAKMAQVILDAFIEKYPATHGTTPRLSDREIIEDVLHLERDTGYNEWIAAHSVPSTQRGPTADPDGDGDSNLLEFAMAARNPAEMDAGSPGTVGLATEGGTQFLTLTYQPRHEDCAYCELVPQSSTELDAWSDLPPASIAENPDGTVTASVPINPGAKVFLRLMARVTG